MSENSTEELQKRLQRLEMELHQSRQLNRNLADTLEREKAERMTRSNIDFIQMYRKQVKELRRLGAKNPLALNLLLLFTEKMNKQNGIMISYGVMQQITKKSRTSVHNAVKTLVDERFIKIVKIGNANAYIINSGVFWRHSAKAKDKLAVFTATIIASGKEQDQEYLENWDNIELKHMPMLNAKELSIDESGTVEEIGAEHLGDFEFEEQQPPEFKLESEIDGTKE